MISTVVLTNTQAAILYILAFAGIWRLLGVSPVKTWFKSQKKHDI